MTRSERLESAFVSPLDADWTIVHLLEWIGADDARCHDVRLFGILDAVDRALHPDASRASGAVVTLVRSLAMRVAAEPDAGRRTLEEVVGVRDAEMPVFVGGGALVTA